MDSGQRYGYSGAGRALWVIWCCMWAGAWLLMMGVLYRNPAGLILTLAGSAASAGAIALPVGKGQRNPP